MYEITQRTEAPYRAICYIECTWVDGSRTSASGVVVGVNDVLTAMHVVYDARPWPAGPPNVPLSSGALAVLAQLPRWDGCTYVVPNSKTKQPYDNLYRAWNRARTLRHHRYRQIGVLSHICA